MQEPLLCWNLYTITSMPQKAMDFITLKMLRVTKNEEQVWKNHYSWSISSLYAMPHLCIQTLITEKMHRY